jgi:hypothetical protein
MARDLPRHVGDVRGTLPHRLGVGGLELAAHLPGDRRQRPLGVDPLPPHSLEDRGEQRLVGGDQAVRLENRRELRSHGAARLPRVPEEILGRLVGGAAQPALLPFHLVRLNRPAKRGRASEPHDDRAPDRDTRSHRKTVQHG